MNIQQDPTGRGLEEESPQGSVLFVIFTIDFSLHLETYWYSVMNGDVTVLLTANKTLNQLEKNKFIALTIAQYCDQNNLVLNEGKTKHEMYELPKLNLQCTKNLDVIEDDCLSWQ